MAYKKTELIEINHILPLKTWDRIPSAGRMLSLSPGINDNTIDQERISVLVDAVKELMVQVENQNMLIKYMMDNYIYDPKELNL